MSIAFLNLYAQPLQASDIPFLQWEDRIILLNSDGNLSSLRYSTSDIEELARLEKNAGLNRDNAKKGKILFYIAETTQLVRIDRESVRHIEKAVISDSQMDFIRSAIREFSRLVFTSTNGAIVIENDVKMMDGPFRKEYSGYTFFLPGDFMDLGEGIDTNDYEGVIGIYHSGLSRAPFPSVTIQSSGWCHGIGHSSVMLDPSGERGGAVSLLARRMFHEWLNQVAHLVETSGCYGMPSPDNIAGYADNADIFYARYILTPEQWRALSYHSNDYSPSNRPDHTENGMPDEWLVCGPFFANAELMLTRKFIDEKNIMPSEGDISGRQQWRRLKSDSEAVKLRRMFPMSRKDSFIYAHTYIYVSSDIEVRLWAGAMEPFSARLNGSEFVRIWGGAGWDTVSRDVILKKGWNRLLLKILDDNSGDNWQFTMRITGRDNKPVDGLKCSAEKPEEDIVDKYGDVLSEPVTYYSWEDVKGDPWGILPILSEHHIESITGVERIRIVSGKNRLSIIPENADSVVSRIISDWEEDDGLNNCLNLKRETIALLRYRSTAEDYRDLVIVRPDMIEPFLELVKYDDDTPPGERIAGYILRNGNPVLVIDTRLGRLPLNEADMLRSKNGILSLETEFSSDGIIRGSESSMKFTVRNTGESIVDIGRLTIGDPIAGGRLLVGNVYNFIPGESRELAWRIPADKLEAGQTILNSSLEYETNSTAGVISRSVPFIVKEPVAVILNIEPGGIIAENIFRAVVTLTNNTGERQNGRINLNLPRRWKARPSSFRYDLSAYEGKKEFVFDVEVRQDDPDGLYEISTVIDIRRGMAPATAVKDVLKANGELISYSFDNAIEGGFAMAEGQYRISLSSANPYAGTACLRVQDAGGSHTGHVWMYRQELMTQGRHSVGTTYSFNTKEFPLIEFMLLYKQGKSNPGIHVILDDGKSGYGIIVHGEWDKLSSRPLVGRADFSANGRWHKVVVDLDAILDEYLGKKPHRVIGIKFGSPDEKDYGLLSGTDFEEFFIDEFVIRKRETK